VAICASDMRATGARVEPTGQWADGSDVGLDRVAATWSATNSCRCQNRPWRAPPVGVGVTVRSVQHQEASSGSGLVETPTMPTVSRKGGEPRAPQQRPRPRRRSRAGALHHQSPLQPFSRSVSTMTHVVAGNASTDHEIKLIFLKNSM
jgi:hypothetical protein